MLNNKRRLPVFPLLMIFAGFVLIIGAILWTTNRPSNTIKISPTATAAPAVSARIPYPEVARTSPATAKEAFDSGTATFIDVRGDSYYSREHIPGALSLTEDELPGHLDELDVSGWIITYCT